MVQPEYDANSEQAFVFVINRELSVEFRLPQTSTRHPDVLILNLTDCDHDYELVPRKIHLHKLVLNVVSKF